MSKKSILVFMGGLSTEHDVSVVSGTNIILNLKHSKYRIYPVFISKDNIWSWSHKYISDYQRGCFNEQYFFGNEFLVKATKDPDLSKLPDVDLAVICAMHGEFGEDGQLQALLENVGIKFTGSNSKASKIAMDKISSKEAYKAAGIPTAPWIVLDKNMNWREDLSNAIKEFGFPLPIKDPIGGSSIGMGIVKSEEEAMKLAEELFQKSPKLLVEKFIEGREASCGFIEGEDFLMPTEIITESGYFDYEAKYEGKSQEVTPADMPVEWIKTMQEYSSLAHECLGLSTYSRTDYRIDKDGAIFALETNTLPGFTPTSLLPQQAAYNGIEYSELLDLLIEKSL